VHGLLLSSEHPVLGCRQHIQARALRHDGEM